MLRWLRGSRTAAAAAEKQKAAEGEAAAALAAPQDKSGSEMEVREGEVEFPRQQPLIQVDTSHPLLTVRGVERSFASGGRMIPVLKGIDMELFPLQLVILKGRSGSGKTTLLNLIGGLDLPSQGSIRFKDRELQECSDDQRTIIRRRDIGFIFQSYALMPLLSAWENVELSLRMAGVPRREWQSRAAHCLELVGLTRRMHHRPFELSGGEQQRVAIAKAIAHKPSLLLADEPTAELDTQMSAQVMAVFREIIRSEGITICMTTHDPTLMEVADRVFEMVDGTFVKQEALEQR